MIAPSSAAAITFAEIAFWSTYPELIAFATAVPTVNSAAKLKVAAHKTALNGVSTRVPTMVAIELAESWKPLMKSKTSATTTIPMTYAITATQLFLSEILSSASDT